MSPARKAELRTLLRRERAEVTRAVTAARVARSRLNTEIDGYEARLAEMERSEHLLA